MLNLWEWIRIIKKKEKNRNKLIRWCEDRVVVVVVEEPLDRWWCDGNGGFDWDETDWSMEFDWSCDGW